MYLPHTPAEIEYREWMTDCLGLAAERLGLRVSGTPVYGWHDRSVGARTEAVGGGQRWLRVVSEPAETASGLYWTGNTDAGAVAVPAKPRVLAVHEWAEGPRRLRAEAMTLLPGRACAPANAVREPVELPDRWWDGLETALAGIAATGTDRVNVSRAKAERRIRGRFGEQLDLPAPPWVTAHGDLHWGNLLGPEFGLLDWESWGQGPAGLDAATLYCYSLLVPATAEQVRARLAGLLAGPAGAFAQLYAASRLLDRAEHGDHPELVEPLTALARRLLGPGTAG